MHPPEFCEEISRDMVLQCVWHSSVLAGSAQQLAGRRAGGELGCFTVLYSLFNAVA